MKFIYTSGARPLEGYTIKRGVGIGGFGEVYFATSDAGKEVALKRIQRNLDVEIRGVTHCLNLKHPNLIAIYDIKYDDHRRGLDRDGVRRGRKPQGCDRSESQRRAAGGGPYFWFGGIAAGVAYLHDHGIVHRDLKPGNIFRDEGVVKIGDYGLSKFISCSRRSGQTESVGTFHYMAPEIGKGVYGKEIDILCAGDHPVRNADRPRPLRGREQSGDHHEAPDGRARSAAGAVRFRRVIERACSKTLPSAILLVVLNSELLIPLFLVLGAAYLVYYGVRSVVITAQGPQRHDAVPPVVEQGFHEAPARGERRHNHKPPRGQWRQRARQYLRRKPAGERLTELTGSFLMAAIVSAVLCLVILVTGGRKLDASVDTWTFYAWLAVTTTVGAWLVLGLAKFWEGTDGDDILRRFVMMVAGLGLGVAAFAAGEMLMIRLSTQEMFNVLELPRDIIPTRMYATDGTLGLTPFLAYFATVFVVLRWWRLVDPLRKTRFSLWATIVVALIAMLIPWQIPWGFLLFVTIAVAVQLSAPWMSSQERSQIRQDGFEE
jgi:hypothetical protein